VERYRLAAEHRTRYLDYLSSILLAAHYNSDATPEWISEAHGEADRCCAALPRFTNWPVDRAPDRRLRIGYVSADFRQHSVAFFLAAIFKAHDPAAVDLCVYHNSSAEDELTTFFRERSAQWCNIHAMSSAEAAQRIHDDRIDILVDLSGHTAGNSIEAFARRPAPIQVNWLGYADTTGLSAMDYRLTDAVADPPGADRFARERLVRMPDAFLCYTAPAQAPQVVPPPVLETGVVTFGSFNNLIKVSASTLNLWAAVLREVPQSRMLIKGRWLELPEMRRRMLDLFAQRGVVPERVELVPRIDATSGHLAAYGRVDVALDTIPYNGTTTTCETLWMGVPVVTLVGDVHAARVSASLLRQVGLDDLAATSKRGYVKAAARLAAEPHVLAELRAGLRQRMAASPLCNAARFTRHLEAAYRGMWRRWCRGEQAQALTIPALKD
jgi:predicted O-linked N-acetylglucosamine transferase (SPINDLY family)